MITLDYYKTNIGIFLQRSSSAYYDISNNVKINGCLLADISKCHSGSKWYFLPDVFEITSYESKCASKKVKTGYSLSVPSVESETIPAFLSLSDVGEHRDSYEDEYVWDHYGHIKSLYQEVYETLHESWNAEEFKLNMIQELNIDSYNNPVDMQISMCDGPFTPKTYTYDLSSVVQYSDIEQMLTPEFLMHERPCSIHSDQVYKIVREYIRSNIDGQYARITSDYDFCFTVKRRVSIKPFINRYEIKKGNGRSYAKPKFKETSVTHKELEIFEMTPASQKYNGYTVIAGWQAKNLQEMADQIKSYLDDLMKVINLPVSECAHCQGTGHQSINKIETNKRD